MDATPPSTTLAELIPIPAEVTPTEGAFQLTAETHILVDAGDGELSRVAEYLAERLRPATGFPLPVFANYEGERKPGSIVLPRKDAPADLGAEGYTLMIQPEGVTLRACQQAGAFYAVQTLCQLLPASIEHATPQPGPWALPCAQLRDQPRFAWRGLMLDVSRHFFDPQTVKQVIEWMAAYKLNRLHLHLSDDQGWRIEIQSWPRLTTIGGSTQVGGGQGGYYTQAEYAELVAFAQSRCVTLVPEIDLPGHTNAALASYPELNCEDTAPDLYTGMGVGFSSLCIRKEITYRFVEDVIRELAALTTGDYLHIGGDEAHSTSHEDYLYFIGRVQELVHKYGKIAVGWGEVAKARLMPQALVQPWHPGIDPAPGAKTSSRSRRVTRITRSAWSLKVAGSAG